MTYSAYERVNDGQLAGPRFLLHAVKLMQHATPAFFLTCAFGLRWVFWISLACGPIAYALVVLRKLWLAWRAKYPLGLFVVDHLPDWMFDASFALVAFGAGVFAAHQPIAGLVVIAIAAVLYVALRSRATP